MSSRGKVSRASDHIRNFGRLFTDLSIDQAARKCVRAAVSWGGLVVVTVDSAGQCTALIAGTALTDRRLASAPADLVGTYHIEGDDQRTEASARAQKHIAEDIWWHWQQIRGAMAA